MTIHQLKDRCWELQPPLDPDRSPHYDNEAAALDALEDACDEAGDQDPETKPVQLASPCWVVQCDGECEMVLDTEDEGYVFHHDTEADAEQTMAAYDWWFDLDGHVWCDEDRPAGAEPPPPSPAELEASGQMRLPGVA